MHHTLRANVGTATLPRGRPPALARSAAAGTLSTISEEHVGGRAVLSVTGEVDISNAADLRTAIERAAARAFEVWLDLSALTFMDVRGVHALIDARIRLIEANTRLTLICPEGPVLRILALTGFDRMFELHGSFSAATHATLA
jgi:anti-sigma B factor antagonist